MQLRLSQLRLFQPGLKLLRSLPRMRQKVSNMSDGKKIIFLEVPASLREEMKHLHHDHDDDHNDTDIEESFSVDPDIPLPVEIESGGLADNGLADLSENLSWEMILSGMIQVVSNSKDYGGEIQPHWVDYYRGFVLAVKPEIYNEFTGAAIIKAKNGDYDMALEITAALEGLFPGSPGVILNKALILEDKAEALERIGHEDAEEVNAGALAAYEEVLSMEPLLPDALFNAGFFFVRRKDYARAAEYFSDYLPLADDDDKKETAEALVEDIKNKGLDDESFGGAVELIRSGEDEEALIKIRDFIERRPTVWNGWFVLGWALRRLGRWEDGLDSFRKAAELGGANTDTKNETAICLMELGDLGAARSELVAALGDEPENVKIISNLGILALREGDDDEAAAFFRTVLELDPNDPIANGYFSRLEN
jgi:tetratricopeptide (TPR) repeat protein